MPTLHHAVYFWLKHPASADDRAALIAGLRGLGAIEQVRSLHIGEPAPIPARDVVEASYDVAELMTFASVEDHNSYQVHPLHKGFIERCGHLWARVQIFDTSETD